MKKRLTLLLAVILIMLGPISIDAAADGDFLIESGVLIRYTGTSSKIDIPKEVTVIGQGAFYMKDIVSVTMPDSVTVIEDSAFSTCGSLTKITLSKNLKKIGDSAFYGCSKLKSITLPQGLESIGSKAFDDCTLLADMNVPTTVKHIGSWDSLPLNWAKSLGKEFVVLGDGILYKYYGGYDSENVVIPDNVKTINEYAFSYDRASTQYIKSITIPGSVKVIGRGAFNQCSDKLSKVTIGEGVMYIDGDIFAGCPNLTQVTIPESLSDTSLVSYRAPWSGNKSGEFDIRGNGVLYKYKGFSADVTIPDGVKHIYDGAFADNSYIKTAKIPKSVESIGNMAFMNCSKLEKADIPNSVKSIGERAFYGCTNLTSVNIPRGVSSIEGRSFYGCSSLKQIDIPDTVESIGELAFARATGLTEIRFANGLRSIGHYAFQNCKELSGVIIPPSVEYIGNMAFEDNVAMRDVIIQNPNTRLHENTLNGNSFSGCRNAIIISPPRGSVERVAKRNKIQFKAIPEGKNSPIVPRNTPVFVNGMKVDFESYTINSSTYFKLRDLAAALNGTKKQFNVEWDVSLGAIKLIPGTPYKPVGGELRISGSEPKSVVGATSPVFKDGDELALFAYQIDGNNYFKLRDIMKLFDVGVTWNKAAGAIGIDTKARYSE